MENISTQIIITKNANSLEIGPAKNRFKIYFEDAQDLKQKIQNLKDLGLYTPEATDFSGDLK